MQNIIVYIVYSIPFRCPYHCCCDISTNPTLYCTHIKYLCINLRCLSIENVHILNNFQIAISCLQLGTTKKLTNFLKAFLKKIFA